MHEGIDQANPKNGALLLTQGLLATPDAKTAHGLIRASSRYQILGVIDDVSAGKDAGEVLDGKRRDIPVFASVREAMDALPVKPKWCVIGVATPGGFLPKPLRETLLTAIDHGMGLVNGLHQFLADDPELKTRAAERGVELIDVRMPPPRSKLSFWTGEILKVPVPRLAVLGTDCALGKRTTARLLVDAWREEGVRAEMIHTGQTGWLQGNEYGIILDSLPNDFVCGELEKAVLRCWREREPDVIVLEGQSSLRNPAGPCGAEFLLSAGAKYVVLQHAPARRYHDCFEDVGIEIGSVKDEIDLIRRYGAKTLAVTLNTKEMSGEEIEKARAELEADLDLPVVAPLVDGVEMLLPILMQGMGLSGDRR